MSMYRRLYRPGGTYFFTVNLRDRTNRLLVDHIDVLREAFAHVQRHHRFHIVAAVVLPEHLHCLWTLAAGDADFSTRWRLIKSRFSRRIEHRPKAAARPGERGVWQRRFWEHLIRDEDDLNRHIDYIHYNPVKHGHVASPGDWPHSSFHQYVRAGILDPNWSADRTIRTMNRE